VVGKTGEQDACAVRITVGPGEVAGDADHETAARSELIVATALHTSDETARIVRSVREYERVTARIAINPLLARPESTDMTADVAAGPGEDRRRRQWWSFVTGRERSAAVAGAERSAAIARDASRILFM
jgi:hypothetical protein